MNMRNSKVAVVFFLACSALTILVVLRQTPNLHKSLKSYVDSQNKEYFLEEVVEEELLGNRTYEFTDFKKDIANYTWYNYKYKGGRVEVDPNYDNNFLNGKVELTFRLTVDGWMITRLFCFLMRSAALFWNPNYGPVVMILDKKDKDSTFFPNRINTFGLPFNFRIVYETGPKRTEHFQKIANITGKTYGYIVQLYSSFMMDQYTNADVIAWTDTDTVMTFPILAKNIVNNGKIVAKGFNTLNFHWVSVWDRCTRETTGFPLVMDFMTYFPVYVLPSTIKGCREHIMKRYKVDNFEDAFVHITDTLSPVNIIMNYAWYFQRGLYEWHFDTGKTDLGVLNEQRFSHESHHIKPSDTIPEIHYSVHITYVPEPNRLPPAMCYLHFAMEHMDIPHCEQYIDKPNMDLFVFQHGRDHVRNWCQGRKNLKFCFDLMQDKYEEIAQLFKAKKLNLDSRLVKLVEDVTMKNYETRCSPYETVPYK